MTSISSVDGLSDRMKWYETQETRRLMPLVPVFARLDGRNFHSFCRNMDKPYDKKLSDMMIALTRFLIEDTGACVGYTQSDEITLAWYSDDPKSQIYCDGRTHKMISLLASTASVWFNKRLAGYFPEKVDLMPMFDCRVWVVPTLTEAANVFVWREQDATKNSISMAARSHFSHNELQHLHGDEMQEKLWQEKQINWNDYPDHFKRGTYVARWKITKPFTPEEISQLPEKHHARLNPDLLVERSQIEVLNLPTITQVTNRVEVLFLGEIVT